MNAKLVIRLVRLQFAPVIIMPVVLGAAAAWSAGRAFSLPLLALCLAGAVCLHVAANAIDDVYDYSNGVDSVSDRLFPRDAPGWKPIPRGLVTVGEGFAVAALFYTLSIAIGVYLSLMVGWPALAIAVPGIVLSWVYTAPPFRLDYRGLGLGELSVLFSFGPIPALGAYYVLTQQVSPVLFLAAVPTGMLTTNVLISHDLLFYDPYRTTGKQSLAVRIGKRSTARLLTGSTFAAYLLVAALVAARGLPITSLVVMFTLPLAVKLADLDGRDRSPPEYGGRTAKAFILSVAFTGLLALGLIL
ncbi:MAG TPA: prenyltransferase [Nitrososphaerales archaeon]|nr:prenyltransferase [Nitrososphaerales archaeon]